MSGTTGPIETDEPGPYAMHRVAPLKSDDDVLVFLAYCPDGKLSPLHLRSLHAYAAEGYKLVLVVNSALSDFTVNPGRNPSIIQIVRGNVGYDFGGWGHAAHLLDDLRRARTLTFVNDSVIGPLPGDGSTELRQLVADIAADVVFMTESVQVRPHGQSYFFAMKRSALDKGAFDVVRNFRCFRTKELVIQHEEVTLAARFEEKGLTVAAAFPCPQAIRLRTNPTHAFWNYLLSTGFPFLKVSLLVGNQVPIDHPEFEAMIGPVFLGDVRKHLRHRAALPPAT